MTAANAAEFSQRPAGFSVPLPGQECSRYARKIRWRRAGITATICSLDRANSNPPGDIAMRRTSLLLAGGLTLVGLSHAALASGFATYFAVVTGNGVVSRSSGVAEAARVNTGIFDVTFNRKINYCATVASISSGNAGYAAIDNEAATVIRVTTFATSGAKANLPFQLIVTCAP